MATALEASAHLPPALQVGAGQIAGVLAAHDLAVERYSPKVAIRSQYAMLVAMIAFTVGGLSLLLGA